MDNNKHYINSNKDKKNSQNKHSNVSDREMLRIIKEDKKFPISFSRRVKLTYLLKFYHKYWNSEFTDESDEETE